MPRCRSENAVHNVVTFQIKGCSLTWVFLELRWTGTDKLRFKLHLRRFVAAPLYNKSTRSCTTRVCTESCTTCRTPRPHWTNRSTWGWGAITERKWTTRVVLRYATVVRLRRCQGITLSSLHISHVIGTAAATRGPRCTALSAAELINSQ